ncbi:MAG TPA: PEGA domain-containing protein [Polyangiaceae bacterium]|nr:PEGA domain-containing protein [Polyangiaceae bacterium]
MPSTGRIVISAAVPRGRTLGTVGVYVDRRKECDTVPCIVEHLSTGSHTVRVLADGYKPPPAQEVVVNARQEADASFTLGVQ